MADPPDREQLLANALAEYLESGELCCQDPEIASELREHLDTLAEIDRLAEGEDASLPERLSGYRVVAEIGSGGMGRVLLALDDALGRKVAIKTLAPRYAGIAELRERFLREARAMARLSHPNIVRIYSLGPANEPAHFVMEHLEGAPLTEAARPLELRQKVELMRKVALAVEFLHRNGVIHRDLKPGNILVGTDLEPKLLDFGLAAETAAAARLTRPGDVLGTPEYCSPEQARGEVQLDERSDVFSLGAVFYELLTGTTPFRAAASDELLRNIREQDPALPRRLNPHLPGELQNVVMKALEKDPAARYRSAREMAADLERYLAGEPVLAAPESYARLMAGKVEMHVQELEAWRRDHLLSDLEYDSFRKCYDRLREREDAWIMEVRRLTLPQVSLYLGAWVLAVGAALLVLFHYLALTGLAAVAVVAAAAAPTVWIGLRRWRSGERRIGVAYLLAFCLLLPLALLVAMGEYGIFSAPTRGRDALELFSKLPSFKRTSNAQLWWALLLSLPAYLWLRRFTRSSVFSLVFAFMAALLALATLLRMGLVEWVETDPGKPYFQLLPFAAAFLAAGMVIERRGFPGDSRHFYPVAVLFTLAALTGVVTFHEPYAKWLTSVAPWTRGQLEYLFIVNAGIYFALQALCDRYPSAQMRSVAKAFRFVIPGHVLTSLLLLGISATDAGRRTEARVFEFVLPAAACAFVFGSIPKQMKNFFAWGLLFLAAGIVRLQQDFFKDSVLWPVGLLAAGLALMVAAAHYTPIRLLLSRWRR